MRRLSLLFVSTLLLGTNAGWSQSPSRQAGYLYLSPVPGASYVSQQTCFVLVRFVDISPAAVTNLATDFITVTGSSSGPHLGATHVATDGRTVIFQMPAPFVLNELVTVNLNPLLAPGASGSVQPFTYEFMVAGPMPGSFPFTVAATNPVPKPRPAAVRKSNQPLVSAQSGPTRRPKAMVMPNGVSVPSDFPRSVITANANPSPGYLFLENALDGAPPYTMMLDNNGWPVWYRKGRMFDFKTQKNGMFSWCQYDVNGLATFSEMDQNLNLIQTFVTTNGYLTDGHDFKILPDGRYFMIGYCVNSVDLSLYIPDAGLADVTETVVQGFTSAGELIFQWRAWDNYNVQDLVPSANADFPHMNGLDIDEDGNVLVSARHLSEVTKINVDSGDIIWRLSGAHSTFTFANDPLNGTSYQHNISALGNGHYMVFDNGDYHPYTVSRAVEYQLDLTNKIANMVWEFRDNPDKYAYWMGNAQRLPSGNTLIDFVMPQYPKAIEVDTNGVKHFELSLVPSCDSYRAFRFPWVGAVAAPYLVVEPQADNITLIFNKFGDTNVASYRIYGGNSPHPTTLLDESAATLKQFTALPNGPYYFRVTAVNNQGIESPFSNEEGITVNLTTPGQNMVQDGNFSQGAGPWSFQLNGGAMGDWTVVDGASQFYITDGGVTLSSIQFLQTNFSLIFGQQYVLEFDAWSDQSGYIQAQLNQAAPPYFDYSGLGPSFLTPNPTHFRYSFTMSQPSDPSANLVFNLGTLGGGIFLANVSLYTPLLGDLNLDSRVDLLDLDIFCGNWLKQQPGVPGDLDQSGAVNFTDFSIFAQSWGAPVP